MVTAGQPGCRLEALASRIVADDYLASFETNRYSVPFQLIGEAVQVQRRGEGLFIFHRNEVVAASAAQRQVTDAHPGGCMVPGRLPPTPACARQPAAVQDREQLEALLQEATGKEMSYADFPDCVLTAAEASNDVHDV
jgi:Mu transposase-like protein